MLINCEVEGVAVDVPPLFVPWKYIVPSLPLAAVIVALVQNVPPPDTVVVAGNGFTVTASSVEYPIMGPLEQVTLKR